MKYRVGDLTIDTGRQLVCRGTNVIGLPKLSYDLLLALVQAAPNLVSADELMRRVWPGLVVSPETVSQRVKMLRDAGLLTIAHDRMLQSLAENARFKAFLSKLMLSA